MTWIIRIHRGDGKPPLEADYADADDARRKYLGADYALRTAYRNHLPESGISVQMLYRDPDGVTQLVKGLRRPGDRVD